jgi:hypothetical protein
LPVSSADHVAVTCHYIDDECNLVEALLDFSKVDGEHSGFNLAAKLMGILEEYDIVEKVNCITSDSASNNNRMVKELEILFNDRGIDWPHEERHIPCVTHVINIAVQEFLKYIKLGELNAETFTLSELLENQCGSVTDAFRFWRARRNGAKSNQGHTGTGTRESGLQS